MQTDAGFPKDKQEQGNAEQTPCVEVGQKDQRGKHHGVIPVVNTAGAAAFIFHEPCLEWAEEENADHITDRIEQTDEKQNARIEDIGIIKCADDRVQQKPHSGDGKGAFGRIQFDCFVFGRNEIFSELLLTPHAFIVRGEEAKNHADHKEDPDDTENERSVLADSEGRGVPIGTMENIQPRCREQQERAKNQLEIMQCGYSGEAYLMFGHAVEVPSFP